MAFRKETPEREEPKDTRSGSGHALTNDHMVAIVPTFAGLVLREYYADDSYTETSLVHIDEVNFTLKDHREYGTSRPWVSLIRTEGE